MVAMWISPALGYRARAIAGPAQVLSRASLGRRDFRERRDPFGRLVEARDEMEIPAARGDIGKASFDADFLEGLEAVGDKAGADHVHPLNAFLRQLYQCRPGIGLQPLGEAEARLEGGDPLAGAELQPVG